MPDVAENAPQELRLRVARFAQQLEAFGGRLLEHAHHDLVGLAARGHVLARGRVELHDVAADLLEKARAALLAERAFFHQSLEHRRHAVQGRERVAVGRQGVLHGLDDMGHGVEADHVRGAEGRRLRAAELGAGQVVDDVIAETEFFAFLDDREDGEHAHAIGDEVRRVFRAHHALAQGLREEGFEVVEDVRVGMRGRDQLGQMHVARRVEEMHAAKTLLEVGIEAIAQGRDRQARSVGGEDRIGRNERRDLLVKVVLPVHALGDRFDHQVAALEFFKVGFVIGLFDEAGLGHIAERRRAELLEVGDRFVDDAVLAAFLGRQIEQHHRHARIDAMRGDLRTHHAGAENRHLLHMKIRHLGSPWFSQNRSSLISSKGLTPARAERMRLAVSGSSLAK